MFHHYTENSSSTGEPPTPPSSSINSVNPQDISNDSSQISLPSSRDSSRSLTVQEPDSGYEASPSSITDTTTSYHFFGEQSVTMTNQTPHCSRQYPEEETEFLDSNSLLLSDSELEDWDTCPDCNSSESCDCLRTDSSTTNVNTAISNCDNTNSSSSRSNFSDVSSNRPSSQPIQIPVLRSCRLRPSAIVIDSQIDLRLQPARSQPLDFNRLQTVHFVAHSHPLSWPSSFTHWRSLRQDFALPLFLRNLNPHLDFQGNNRFRRSNRRCVRSRRQIIDSDASSVCSSDEDGPEDVFNLAAEEASPYSLCPMVSVNSSPPLPDVVLQSTDARRSRSVSVNLPPEPELLQSIGSTLRRLSDQFQIRREITLANRTRRRQTIGSITQLNGLS